MIQKKHRTKTHKLNYFRIKMIKTRSTNATNSQIPKILASNNIVLFSTMSSLNLYLPSEKYLLTYLIGYEGS